MLGLILQASSLAAQTPVPIQLNELPTPPKEIADLIRQGDVKFEAGPRAETAATNRGLDAETHFKLEYKYNSHNRWKNSRSTLLVTMRFSGVQLVPQHRVWFRNRPATESFWSNPLVLHEFDHIRISSDPRLHKRFVELLSNRRSISAVVRPGDVVDQAYVDRLVQLYVDDVFAMIEDLVTIRYRELDRLTSHGRLPLPSDSELSRLLKSEAEE